MIFVNSMSDLFHEEVPDDFIEAICRGDGNGQLAYLPGAYQALPSDGRALQGRLRTWRRSASYLVGRERR